MNALLIMVVVQSMHNVSTLLVELEYVIAMLATLVMESIAQVICQVFFSVAVTPTFMHCGKL